MSMQFDTSEKQKAATILATGLALHYRNALVETLAEFDRGDPVVAHMRGTELLTPPADLDACVGLACHFIDEMDPDVWRDIGRELRDYGDL